MYTTCATCTTIFDGRTRMREREIEQELRIIAENLANLIQKNASVALDQTEQAEKEEKLRTLYGEKHSRFLELESLIQEKMIPRRYSRTLSPSWRI